MNLYVGTSGYSYKEWKGSFYPEDIHADQMLTYYASKFTSVEINNTFHRMPKTSVIECWEREVPEGFKFAIKAPQRITHMQRLKNAADSVSLLVRVLEQLQGKLGPILFQLPPNMKKDLPRLQEFLKLLPRSYRAAFEFRHESWFDDEVFTAMREHNAALCIAEAEGDLEVPFVSTADWGYLRLRRPDYTQEDLLTKYKRVSEQTWTDTYVFFKHEDEAKGPKLAAMFIECGRGQLAEKPKRRVASSVRPGQQERPPKETSAHATPRASKAGKRRHEA